MDRDAADAILRELTETESLLKHARSVELVMRRAAEVHGGDPDEWGIAGLLHDADYEKHPDEHPNIIVARLRELGEEPLAYAISAHYTKWNVRKEIGSAQNKPGYCEGLVDNIVENLTAQGYLCRSLDDDENVESVYEQFK